MSVADRAEMLPVGTPAVRIDDDGTCRWDRVDGRDFRNRAYRLTQRYSTYPVDPIRIGSWVVVVQGRGYAHGRVDAFNPQTGMPILTMIPWILDNLARASEAGSASPRPSASSPCSSSARHS